MTGARDRVSSGAEGLVRRIRAHSALPIALGFGISRPEHVAEVTAYADAAVVGSALVSLIADAGTTPQLVERVEDYVRWLKGASAGGPCEESGPASAAPRVSGTPRA